MSKIGWLVNDYLTCIPGTRTFWHDLLEWIPGLIDMTGTRFPGISNRLDRLDTTGLDYLIRNASYFRYLDIDVPQIVFVQDVCHGNLAEMQNVVRNLATARVFNSEYTKDRIGGWPDDPVIPISVDFDAFDPRKIPRMGEDVLFVGANTEVKGVDKFLSVVEQTKYKFHAVMKDGHQFKHSRVTNYSMLTHEQLREVMAKCRVLVCTSREETQHLAGIEAGAMGLSVVAPPVGCYWGLDSDAIGRVYYEGRAVEALHYVMSRPQVNPRKYLMEIFSRDTCKQSWLDLIKDVT